MNDKFRALGIVGLLAIGFLLSKAVDVALPVVVSFVSPSTASLYEFHDRIGKLEAERQQHDAWLRQLSSQLRDAGTRLNRLERGRTGSQPIGSEAPQ